MRMIRTPHMTLRQGTKVAIHPVADNLILDTVAQQVYMILLDTVLLKEILEDMNNLDIGHQVIRILDTERQTSMDKTILDIGCQICNNINNKIQPILEATIDLIFKMGKKFTHLITFMSMKGTYLKKKIGPFWNFLSFRGKSVLKSWGTTCLPD